MKFKLEIVTGSILRKNIVRREFHAENVIGARAFALSCIREAGEDATVLRALLSYGNGVPIGHIFPPNTNGYEWPQWCGINGSNRFVIGEDGNLGVRLPREG